MQYNRVNDIYVEVTMEIKPDDYYNNGTVEMARFGRHTLLKNNMSREQHKKMMKRLKRKYPVLKKRIDRLVQALRKKISKCNPVNLLSFASDLALTSNLGISSEFQSTGNDIVVSRMTEYIQSVIVSTPTKYKETNRDQSKQFFKIKKDFEKLYRQIHIFYLALGAALEDMYPNYDEKTRRIMVESQFLYTVRGDRYQIFEVEYFEKLLRVHNDVFVQLFGMTSDEIIVGIKKLQHALSQGKLDAFNDFAVLMEEFFEQDALDAQKFSEIHMEENSQFVEKFMGTRLRNVIEVTGWNEKFVDALSFGVGECCEFFEKGEYAGWPIIDLPIQKRPFIKINNQYFCFDYYSFMDNFYRVIQKTVSRLKSDYRWADLQKEASENMVSEVFSEMFPGCVIHRDNYYPKNKSLKEMAENDLIIEYENVLIIVEVKAGSFVFTPPINDFDNHIRSYKSLIEKADHQCKRTYDYLCSEDKPFLYTEDGSPKTQLDMSKIVDMFMITVTIDNINDFAARAEKLNFLNLKCDAISLAIDDLMVYRSYFENPLILLHFLCQRRNATQEERLALNDELDHLGMYIKHNMYCLELSDVPEGTEIMFQGYREELDNYFCSLYHSELTPKKPELEIPQRLLEIIDFLLTSEIANKVEISNYILNFSSDARETLVSGIDYALKRQLETGWMLAFGASGEGDNSLRYTVFVEQPNINVFTEEYKKDYVLSTLLWNKENDRVMLCLSYNVDGKLIDLGFTKFDTVDVQEMDVRKLIEQGEKRARMRVQAYMNSHGSIDDEEWCPCGSGKKYIECCKGV